MKIKQTLKKNKVLKAGTGYTISNYLLKGLGFITVPIFSRLLEISDFGIYNTFLSYEGILYLFIGVALHSSIKNAKYKFGQECLNAYTSSVTLVPLFISILYLIIGNLSLPIIQEIIAVDRLQLNLLIIFCWGTSILYIYQSRLVLDYDTKEYLGLSYFNAISCMTLSIALVLFVFPKQRYLGRIVGTVLPMALIAIWITIRLYKQAKPQIIAEYWKYGLKISIPIIPHGIGQVLLTSFDRIMITNMIGTSESGLYSFAYTIYSIILVTGNSISTVFEPWAYSKLSEGNKKELSKRASEFILGLAVLCAGTMLLAPELVLLLGSEKYRGAIPALTPVLFGGFFAMAYTMPSIIEYYKEKTSYIAIGTAMAAALNIVLNAWLIPKYGYIAAAYTTLVSYLVYYTYHSIIAYHLSGFWVIPLTVNLMATLLLSIVSFIALVFVDKIFVRYSVGVTIVLVVVIFLWKRWRWRSTFGNKEKSV